MVKRALLLLLLLLTFCAASAVALAAGFTVTSIVVDQSELLDQAAIRNIVAEYEGKTVSLSDLQRAVDAINALYAKEKLITAKAILPPQEIKDGVVHIRLVEGRVGDVTVVDNKATRTSFFRKRIPVKPGDLVRTDVLEEAIARFNGVYDVQLRAELKPGKQFGTTDVVLTAFEPPAYRLSQFADDAGREETGLYRRGVTFVKTSLFGYQDPLTVSSVRSSGSTAWSAAYSLPVGAEGARLGVGYDDSGIEVVSGQFEDVEISGHSKDYNLNLNRPLVVTPGRRLDGFMEVHAKSSTSQIADTFDWSTTRTTSAVFGLSTQSSGESEASTFRHDVTVGRVHPKSYREPDEDKDFLKYDAAFTWQRVRADGNSLTFRSAVQLTLDKLLPFAEQFSVGGGGTVRGYPEGFRIGDQGYYLSLEQTFAATEKAQGFIFLDHGAAFPFKGNDEPVDCTDFLTSVGIGAAFNARGVSGKIVLGIPARGKNTLARLHIFVQASL